MNIYSYFLDGVPAYLARHYWWAYLWRPAAWFFDHQAVINMILFGQYKKLMEATICRIDTNTNNKILQLTCVYGLLTPKIVEKINPGSLHITDVSNLQLERTKYKVSNDQKLITTRMNVESLAYKSNSFNMIVIFFLLHEMPMKARRNTLSECMRTLSVDGTLLYTEYASQPKNNYLYRFPLSRVLLTKLEPFLESYWDEDILTILRELARPYNKDIEVVQHTLIFSGFYRVTEFKVVNAV